MIRLLTGEFPVDEELRRQVIHTLGVLAVGGLFRPCPSLPPTSCVRSGPTHGQWPGLAGMIKPVGRVPHVLVPLLHHRSYRAGPDGVSRRLLRNGPETIAGRDIGGAPVRGGGTPYRDRQRPICPAGEANHSDSRWWGPCGIGGDERPSRKQYVAAEPCFPNRRNIPAIASLLSSYLILIGPSHV